MLNRKSLFFKTLSFCFATGLICSAVALTPPRVEAMTESTYRFNVTFIPEEDGYIVEEGCDGPAGGCYVVTA